MARTVFFIPVALALLVAAAVAQQVTGNLEGRIVDAEGKPLAAANIIVSSPDLQGMRGAAGDEHGYFRMLALPAGSYSIEISHVGYQSVIYDRIPVRLGKTTFMGEVRLKSQVIEMPAITVSSEKPLIDPASTTTGANLVAETYEVLPVERNYRNITTLLPQASESFLGDEVNFAGSTGSENKYFIDGIDVTDPWRGLTGTNLPYNFVKEIEVKAGGYEAEYRSALGAVVNVITYSGSNDFHGQAFAYFSNNRFAGEPRLGALEPNKGDFSQYDVGLSLGGPIMRNKLWFFAAYNPNFEREDVEIPGLGFFDDNNTIHIFAGKITWRASDNNQFFLTIFGDPSHRRAVGVTYGGFGTPTAFVNPDPYLGDIRFGGVNLSFNGNHIINDRLLLETSFSRTSRQEQYMPATERGRNEVLFIDAETGIWSGGYPSRVDELSIQSYAGIKGTLIWKRHKFKAGLEYKSNRLDNNIEAESLLRFGPTSYAYIPVGNKGTLGNRVPSVFAQDTWQLTDRLRINAGLRWDGQFLVGSNGKIAQRITDQYAPRIGFVYQLGEVGTQRVFGSLGRFYQELSTFFLTFFANEGSYIHYITYDHDPRVNPAGGDSISFVGTIRPQTKDLKGQHYDEFNLGYERQIGKHFKLSLLGSYRTLRQIIEDGSVPDGGEFFLGNPGRGLLKIYPTAKRDYTALELTAERFGAAKFNFLVSYVWSRNYGNYPGLFSDFKNPFPNASGAFDFVELLNNATGLLPNDRTHVFKLSGSYRLAFGLTVGTSFSWQTGTPLSEFGGTHFPPYFGFVRQRGTVGRTPSICDLNLRMVYEMKQWPQTSWKPRLILDIFHIASPRKAVDFEQIHYFNIDENGNQINPNSIYGRAIRYQPPMALRLGLEMRF